MTFAVGDRVIRADTVKSFNEYEIDVLSGVVHSLTENPDKVSVKWDSKYINKGKPQRVSISSLISETEGEEAYSKLESEYEAWAGPIRDKLKQAAALLKEAGELANIEGRELTDMWNLTGDLTSAMSDIGWRTSSLSC